MATSSPRVLSSTQKSKEFGAYYTAPAIAHFLAQWAIRNATDTVLDPCFGGGVFIGAACQRITSLGGETSQARGYEIDPAVHQSVSRELSRTWRIPPRRLVLADFFTVSAGEQPVDVVVGNPPFIRYQRFSGDQRKLALSQCQSHGVALQSLSSSWAPFLIHAIAMLRRGGRLAMVIPTEISHAKYARPVLAHLRDSFATVSFLTFRAKLFPDLNEDVLLVLAEGKGDGPGQFHLAQYQSADDLASACEGDYRLTANRRIDASRIASASSRIIEYLIPPTARALYDSLRGSQATCALQELADVGIGYVTGANEYFHLSPEEAKQHSIPSRFLKPCLRRGRALIGLRFLETDWEEATRTGNGGYLLHVPGDRQLPEAVRSYLRKGEALGIPRAYKCRTRPNWFSVPHVHRPDAFLTYMSGEIPLLAANHALAYAPNTLHVVRMRPLVDMPPLALAALWQTSLTRLSVEIEGHALGGGMLKLEPNEAKRVQLPRVHAKHVPRLLQLGDELDGLHRAKKSSEAQSLADAIILREMIGLSLRQCKLLYDAGRDLAGRRGYGRVGNVVA